MLITSALFRIFRLSAPHIPADAADRHPYTRCPSPLLWSSPCKHRRLIVKLPEKLITRSRESLPPVLPESALRRPHSVVDKNQFVIPRAAPKTGVARIEPMQRLRCKQKSRSRSSLVSVRSYFPSCSAGFWSTVCFIFLLIFPCCLSVFLIFLLTHISSFN